MMNIKILLAIAVLTVWAAVVLVVNLRWESSKGEAEEARATTEIAVELETAQARTEQTEALNRMETDDQVVRSILKGLDLDRDPTPVGNKRSNSSFRSTWRNRWERSIWWTQSKIPASSM